MLLHSKLESAAISVKTAECQIARYVWSAWIKGVDFRGNFEEKDFQILRKSLHDGSDVREEAVQQCDFDRIASAIEPTCHP